MKKKAYLLLCLLLLTGCERPVNTESTEEPTTPIQNIVATEDVAYTPTDTVFPINEDPLPSSAPTEIVLSDETMLIGDAEKDSVFTGGRLYASEWKDIPYATINNNIPFFTKEEKENCYKNGQYVSFENYSPLDALNRTRQAFVCVGIDTMPTEERGEIGQIKPSGWQTSKYPKEVIEDLFLWNRCHLSAYELTSENDNALNLITGTRYMNVEGMLPFENKIANFIRKNKDMHVLYRITPEYKEDDLVAQGILMEGYSLEDNGKGICFCVFCYNIQPFIEIDYKTGENRLSPDYDSREESGEEKTYILNTNSMKIHTPDCEAVRDMKNKNKKEVTALLEELLKEGYKPCGICNAGQ